MKLVGANGRRFKINHLLLAGDTAIAADAREVLQTGV